MRWLAAATRFVAASLAAYALLAAVEGAYMALAGFLATPALQLFAGGNATLGWDGRQLALSWPGGGVGLEAPFLLVSWPLYLGLAAAVPSRVRAHPGRVAGGLGLLLLVQIVTLVCLSLRFAWGNGHPAIQAVKLLAVLLVGGQHVLPPALWWLQFSPGSASRPRAT